MTDVTDDIAEEISFQGFEDDCRLLGNLLNDVLQREVGPHFMEKLEKTKVLAQSACTMRMAGIEDTAELVEKQMAAELSNMSLEDALSLARAFSHYLNLTGIAETHHSRVTKARRPAKLSKSCDDTFNQLVHGGVSPDELYDTVCKQVVEIVLTAHPTQINRRTLQYKHIRIAHLLEYNDRPDLGHEDREMLIEDLMREIASIWQTDELRRHQPTPVDEARAGLNIVEQSLWRAVPHYLRRVSNALKKHTGRPLPLTCTPIKFGSWMGGDRDGNPNVTAKVTRSVTLLSRWMAVDLYIREVDSLRFELSMNQCNAKLSRMAHEILGKADLTEGRHDGWNQPSPQNYIKNLGHHSLPFPTQLPTGADQPSCSDCNNVESQYPRLDVPGTEFMPLNRQDGKASSRDRESSHCEVSKETHEENNTSNSGSFGSNQLLENRKLFAESNVGRASFRELLEPISFQSPGIAPYRVVFGDVKEKVLLELFQTCD
ncbi:hypothetical protein BUALT_Bualt17G0090700 [Buddleja alternifolia]|uniref:Phosphoenolpyruvate carboxylase n=1 Tax=Buddleja alternifolia TaxID=168488 RepID=A0AAV6WGD2_9LAMI|nr:hypothetical protein BUALT_Bualt17G0090700 [Buddleja alternifolia]